MNISLAVKDLDRPGTEVQAGIHDASDVLIVMVKQGEDGQLVVETYEPLEIDKHPDTLRQIGGRIVDFAT